MSLVKQAVAMQSSLDGQREKKEGQFSSITLSSVWENVMVHPIKSSLD